MDAFQLGRYAKGKVRLIPYRICEWQQEIEIHDEVTKTRGKTADPLDFIYEQISSQELKMFRSS